MGTPITLDIGGVAVDWSKNGIGVHHGPLFQEQDRRRLPPEREDPEQNDELAEDSGLGRMAFRRPLRSVLPRLEMLGISLGAVRAAYEDATQKWYDLGSVLTDADSLNSESRPPEPLHFDEFLAFVCAYPLADLDETPYWEISIIAEQMIRGRFEGSVEVTRIPVNIDGGSDGYSERSYFLGVIGILGPYATLRLLAEQPANLDFDVDWEYGPLVDSGWADVDDFICGPRRHQKTLVATEGSSDVHILDHALKLLRPDVADFFSFIDISERHPFSGTGSLVNFAEGLTKIDVQNQVIFLFDNDVEGVDAAARVRSMKLPTNMCVLLLPDIAEFERFPAQGPDGVSLSNINGRAAAIECYLDLRLKDRPAASVQWTNLKREPDVYQGALKFKEAYVKPFLQLTAETIECGSYDITKIERVLDMLIAECGRLTMVAANAQNRTITE